MSPAARGRGLKLEILRNAKGEGLSPAARGRGLKPDYVCFKWLGYGVARCARAWIETVHRRGKSAHLVSPAARGRGLKQCNLRLHNPAVGRPLRAGVD